MQKNKLIRIYVILLITFVITAAKDYSMYFGNLNLAFNDRLGVFDLGYGHEEKVNKDLLLTIGAEIGKNFALPANFRISLPLLFDIGTINNGSVDNVLLTNGTVVSEAKLDFIFINVGISPEVLYVIHESGLFHPFLGAGGGIHFVKFNEREWNGNSQIINSKLQSYSGVRWSVCGTIGADFIINRHIGITTHYRFRYWYPVNGEYSEDLPYHDVDYKERFMSHQAGIGILIGK
jgi:hypothetical protein